jgi:FkbM family methyltransferase
MLRRLIGDRPYSMKMARRGAANAYLGNGLSLCRVLDRYKMYVPSRDRSVTPHLLLDGIWERWVTQAISERVKPGMTVADVGANVGYFSTLMADLVGAQGLVHAFEPNEELIALVRENAVVNGFGDRVTTHPVALGGEDGREMLLVTPGDYLGGAALWQIDSQPSFDHRRVVLRRLDAIEGADRIEFVKIDAEGAEPDIWRGMKGLLDGDVLKGVFIEFTAGHYQDPLAFLQEIRAAGFSLSIIDENQGPLPISPEKLLSLPANIGPMLQLER